MTTLTLQKRLNAGIPGLRLAPAMSGRAACAARARPSIATTVTLDCADMLRIRDGRGTRVRVVSGVLWVTEESNRTDHVLLQGDAIELAMGGTAIASACLRTDMVIEVPAGTALPAAVEMVPANGKPRRSVLASSAPVSLSTIAAGIATVIGNALASMRKIGTRYADRYLPSYLRRRVPHSTRRVERVVIDDWLIWRR